MRFERAGVAVHMVRLDQVHRQVSGNKWFKLKHNLLAAQAEGCGCVISFGGAWSNHIHALAWAGQQLDIKTVGVIRGEPGYAANPTLRDAAQWGMELHFVDRQSYRLRHQLAYQHQLCERWPGSRVIPEGGSNALALLGFESLALEVRRQCPAATHWVTAVGSGGTLAGLSRYASVDCRVLGVAALKKAGFLYADIRSLLADQSYQAMWGVDLEGHQGGYAKTTTELLAYLARFKQEFGIQLDHVYTGKMMLRVEQLIQQRCFAKGAELVVFHTGGVQGLRGLA